MLLQSHGNDYGTLFAIIKLSLAFEELAFLEKTLCCPLKVLCMV